MDLFGKRRIQECEYALKMQKAKSDERISQQEEIIKSQATVISMLCRKLRAYEGDVISENESLKKELDKAIAANNTLLEYANNLEIKLKEAS